MSQSVTIIFPHQLFKTNRALHAGRPVYLIEEWLFFRQYNFHFQKLVLHRASMKFYKDWVEAKTYKVHYVESGDKRSDCRNLLLYLSSRNIKTVHITDPTDNWLLARIKKFCKKLDIKLEIYPTPNFIVSIDAANELFERKRTYFQTDFYIWQRKQLNILIESGSSPVGGKWTFDSDNRKKIPKKHTLPVRPIFEENDYIREAKKYIAKNFPLAYGSENSVSLFACTFADAEKCLDDFFKNRFLHFGVYEDAIVAQEHVLYHSVLTPMLNIGLLTPRAIINKAIDFAAHNDIPINSLEGFIRQIIGWREFIRQVYEREGSHQRTKNYWNFKRKIPSSFWTGNTGIKPLDTTIKKILKTGYCHHIERLMLLGNFMLLCEFDPDQVYRWFMEMFIDAYDWVMVPNVYGMTQFADGGLMTTKPYISGSNYLMKMSDYAKGEWNEIWDALFWRFMHVHRNFFSTNPRLGMLLKTFDSMDNTKQTTHLLNAEKYLKALDASAKS